ncbi:MAG: hypothetical protein AB3N63_15075 [Puniceicoccaceae bacterium]
MGKTFQFIWLSAAALLTCFTQLTAREGNLWPFRTEIADSPVGRNDHVGHLGPIISITEKPNRQILSIRPFYTHFEYTDTGTSSSHFVYPFVNWHDQGEVQFGNVLNLIQYRRNQASEESFFQAFPFVFRYKAQEPEDSYFAVWPIGGTLKNRLFRDRITFAAWPLFVQTEKGDETRTHIPYPFVQMLDGPKSRGFGLWPIYGHFERDNDYDHTWAAWPFFYNLKDDLDKQEPYVRFGALPFYARETASGLKSETWAWPFFGYTREWEPRVKYSENRYLWPFLVQGRGEEKYVNRWMPFYTHETRPGKAKRWYMWPFLKTEKFKEPGIVRDRTSLLYFLYRDEKQHFSGTTARLTTVWPLLGYWNDGRGNRQMQMPDPFTVFFPRNEKVKENWSPLFALYRFDERMENKRHSVLWDFIVWEKEADRLEALYVGPVFQWVRDDHWELLRGFAGGTMGTPEKQKWFFWRKRPGG